MKVKEMVSFANGTVRLVLESEHPAELAMIRLLDNCEATCEAKSPDVPASTPGNGPNPVPDPELRINVTVKKGRY